MVQVAPAKAPGFLARLFGQSASADRTDCFDAAVLVHRVVAEAGFTSIRWLWDGPPNGASAATPAPIRYEARNAIATR